MADEKKASKAFNDAQDRDLVLRLIPLHLDAVSVDIISAGWLLSQMDLAGGVYSDEYADSRMVTIGIEDMSFDKPVYAGDTVTINAQVVRHRPGGSSVTLYLEAWARRRRTNVVEKVTEGFFTFVAIDENHNKVSISRTPPSDLASRPQPKVSEDIMGRGAGTFPPQDMELTEKVVAEQKNTNYLGDIFGGWLLAYMETACMQRAEESTGQNMATRALDSMKFYAPVHVGDEVSFYTQIVKTGQTSLKVRTEVWARRADGTNDKVTEGSFTYVAIDNNLKPVPVTPQPA